MTQWGKNPIAMEPRFLTYSLPALLKQAAEVNR